MTELYDDAVRVLKPVRDADEIEGGSGEDLLEPRFGQADVAGLAAATDAQRLGDHARHPGAPPGAPWRIAALS